MGIFDFVKAAGRKIGLFDDEPKEPTPEEIAANNQAMSQKLTEAVQSLGLNIENLSIAFDTDMASINGTTPSRSEAEKVVLTVGNHEGVARVDDRIEVVKPEPPAVFYTVVSGDSLSAISKRHYGVLQLFDTIFEANRPMLNHPDEIYPGQVLRIPPVSGATHTVAKGETLGGIAKHWFGDAKQYTTIFEANRSVLSSPDKVEIGQELAIPLTPSQLTQPVA